jgi:hypothetical protein
MIDVPIYEWEKRDVFSPNKPGLYVETVWSNGEVTPYGHFLVVRAITYKGTYGLTYEGVQPEDYDEVLQQLLMLARGKFTEDEWVISLACPTG